MMSVNAVASDCTQERAVYVEELSGTIVRFRPDDEGTTVDSFQMQLPSGELLTGKIIWNMGIARPNAAILAPECDSGADDCTVWDGTLYELREDGLIGLYSDGDAASQILFPDLSRVLWFRAMEHDWLTPRNDTFFLLRCPPEDTD